MVKPIQYFSQSEYNRILNSNSARARCLSQSRCEDILVDHGASHERAKNGAYVYLHHDGNLGSIRRGYRQEYERPLNEYGARNRAPQQCIRYLEGLGFSYGQSKTAVYNYRKDKGLIGSH